jgi:nucleotide-binding universal stress UspA family protein
MEDIRKIMVLAMEIRNSRKATQKGVSLAKKFKADLYVLHVEHNPFGEQGWNLPFLSLDDAYLELIKKDKKELAELLRTEEAGGLSVKKLIVRDEPVAAIREAVAREKIDLLIAPAHEESRFEHFLFGHLNEEILRCMPCSVLFVKEASTKEE